MRMLGAKRAYGMRFIHPVGVKRAESDAAASG